MNEIPDDVELKAAQVVVMLPPFKGVPETADAIERIASAIMAERERCAKIIEDNMLVDWPVGSESMIPRSNSGNKVGLAYADAIRSHPKQGDVK